MEGWQGLNVLASVASHNPNLKAWGPKYVGRQGERGRQGEGEGGMLQCGQGKPGLELAGATEES
jgi:hypothetical protein